MLRRYFSARLSAPIMLLAALWLTGCGDGAEEQDPKRAEVHITSGRAYEQQGQYRAAMIEARNAIKKAPQNPNGYQLLARLYTDLGDAKAAAELLQEAPAGVVGPDHQLLLAEAYIEQGKNRSAMETLNAVEGDIQGEQRPQWQILRARALAGEGDQAAAQDLLSQLVERQPELAQARLALGRLHLMAEEHDLAEAQLAQIDTESPVYSEAQQLRAIIAYQANEMERAETLLSDALAAMPETDIITPLKARVLRQLSQTLTQLGRSSEALIYQRLLAEAVPGMQDRRQQFNQALELYRTGNIEEAEELLTELYEVNPDSDTSGLLLGLMRYQQGDYSAAGELFNQHLDTETTSPQLIEAAALAQLRQSRGDEALDLLRQALKDHPESPNLLAIYGMTALRDPNLREDGAIALQKAVALQPERSELRLPLANYYIQTNKLEQAEAQLQTAASNAPGDHRVQSAYITYLLTQGEQEKAQEAVDTYLSSSGDSAEAQVLKGRVETESGNPEAARKAYQAALAADPDNPEAEEGLGRLALRRQDWATAATHFERATELEPQRERNYKSLITTYEAQGDNLGGERALRELARDPERAATAQAVLAEYHLRRQQLDKASEAAREALETGRDQPYVQRTAAAVFRSQARQAQDRGNEKRARSRLMAALELYPENVGLLSDLVVVELAAGRRNEAERIIERIQRQPGGATPAALMKAYAQQQGGNREAAVATLREAWDEEPTPAVGQRLYQLHMQGGEQTAALDLATDWGNRFPRDPRPLTYLALAEQERGNNEEARRYYEEALDLDPNNPMLLNNLAWLYFEDGDDRARELARKASERAPDNANVLDTYGWILVRSGERAEGLKLLERAASIDPDSKEIAEHLEQARSAG